MEIYYQKPYITISWDEELKCIVTEWKGFVYGDDFHTGLNKMLELAKSKQATKAVNDTRKLRTISQEDQDWVLKDWISRAIQSGLHFYASIIPEAELAKHSYKNIATKVENKIPLENAQFDSLEKAREWLRSC